VSFALLLLYYALLANLGNDGHSHCILAIIPVERNNYRISKLEMLDEVEELDLVLQHYAITWGAKLPNSVDGSKPMAKWLEWGMKPSVESIHVEEENENV